jgi:hypothetical protein
MTQVMDTARSSALPRELELQLLVGNAVESLLTLVAGTDEPADDASIGVIRELATLFDHGVEDLRGTSRTLAQSASSLGVVGATRRAVAGTGRSAESQLQDLASKLTAIAANRTTTEQDVEALITPLEKLHEVLASSRSLVSDEVRGFRRQD